MTWYVKMPLIGEFCQICVHVSHVEPTQELISVLLMFSDENLSMVWTFLEVPQIPGLWPSKEPKHFSISSGGYKQLLVTTKGKW